MHDARRTNPCSMFQISNIVVQKTQATDQCWSKGAIDLTR